MTRQMADRSQIKFDDGPFPKGRLSFVCVANAGLTETDMARMCPEGVGLSFTHMAMQTDCTIENLAGMESDLDEALARFLPARNDIDVLCYNCTAGSFVIGEDKVTAILRDHPSHPVATTLLSGVVAALRAFGVKRFSLATAYTDDINALEQAYFAHAGFEMPIVSGLGLMTDIEMNKVSPAYLREFAISLDHRESEAVFLSCGALRSLEILEDVEQAIGKPVFCSNQASFWHCLRLAGASDQMSGFGRLLQTR